MPNPSETVSVANKVEAKPSLADQYLIGDDLDTGTEVDENADISTPEAPVPTAVKPAAEEPALPPRGADGKFLPKSEVSETPALPARLVRLAEELGFSEDDLEGATKEQVEDWVYAANKAALKSRKAESLIEVRERRKPDGNVATQTEGPDEFDQAIEAGFAPELVDIVRKQATRIDQLEKMVGQLSHAERGRQVETFASKLDAAIDKLGMDSLFGQGRGMEMDPDSLEFKRRVKIAEEVDRDKSKKSLQAKVEAAGALFGYTRAKVAPPAPTSTPAPKANGHSDDEDFEKQWTRGTLARPTARPSQDPKGDKKAVATAREYMRNNGMLEDDEAGRDGFL